MKAKATPKNICAYLQGNVRYFMYHKGLRFLIRPLILTQYEFRLKMMNSKCYEEGSCVLCGCKTTALQFANKECDKPCYPPFLDEKSWKSFAQYKGIKFKGHTYRLEKYKNIFSLYKDSKLVHSKAF